MSVCNIKCRNLLHLPLYLDGFWYLLKAKPELYEGKDVVGQLDSQILQDVVLGPVLGIGDPRTDKRIKFVGGSHKLRELQDTYQSNASPLALQENPEQ